MEATHKNSIIRYYRWGTITAQVLVMRLGRRMFESAVMGLVLVMSQNHKFFATPMVNMSAINIKYGK